MKKVVILGGGFAGSQVALGLERDFDVVLIDRKPYFEYTPGILRGIQDLGALEGLRVRHRDYLRKSEIVIGEVSEVRDGSVKVGNGLLEYDYLVIASGGKSRAFFKGPRVFSAYHGKDMEKAFGPVQKAKKIVVVGGGLVGVELAAELAQKYVGKKVVLVHPGEEVLERQEKRTRRLAAKWLRRHGVDLVLGERVVRQAGKFVVCQSGRKLEADVVFSCVGVGSNYEFLARRFPGVLDERQLVNVGGDLLVKGLGNVFAVGDVSSVRQEKTAQNAELQAHVVVSNVKKLARENSSPSARGSEGAGKASGIKLQAKADGEGSSLGGDVGLRTYKSGKRIMVVSLGSKSGILEWRRLVVGGWIGALAKWFTEKWVMRNYN
ncbi:hypothetical protein CMI48_01045 [Candidatus Pacearchaeota archaeon]|nr:hypothetical protein [Candidatus Pacearchaeota archaeon]